MINSSVSIPSELRKRIKRLAAERDTSQAQIIEVAINLYENKEKDDYFGWNQDELELLTKIELELFNLDPSREERVKKLTRAKIDIEHAIISDWDSGLIENGF